MIPLIFISITLLLFILGAAVGSFVNVLIFRTVDTPEHFPDESWKTGRSRCDHCGRPLHWYENIPLLSFTLQRGRSRCCTKSLSITHPVVELLSASLFVWWFWGGALFFQLAQGPFELIQPIFWLLVGILLLVIVVSDIAYAMLLPQWALLGLTALAASYRVALTVAGIMRWQDLLTMLLAMIAVVALFFAIWFFSGGQALGFGDVEFAAPMTLLLGWPNIIVGLYVAVLSGAIIGSGSILLERIRGDMSPDSDVATETDQLGHRIPFGPFLVFGTLVALVWGEVLLRWYWQLF